MVKKDNIISIPLGENLLVEINLMKEKIENNPNTLEVIENYYNKFKKEIKDNLINLNKEIPATFDLIICLNKYDYVVISFSVYFKDKKESKEIFSQILKEFISSNKKYEILSVISFFEATYKKIEMNKDEFKNINEIDLNKLKNIEDKDCILFQCEEKDTISCESYEIIRFNEGTIISDKIAFSTLRNKNKNDIGGTFSNFIS